MAFSRKKSREIVFRMLFAGADMELACEDETLPVGVELEYINNLFKIATEHQPEIDEIIKKHIVGFTIERLNKTDLTALRLGIAEIKYTQIEKPVAINEAVEIAKRYGTEKSASFVNGVLSKI